MPRKLKKEINIPELIRLYNDGESELALSKFYYCSRRAIRNRLLSSGTTVRSRSEANVESAKRIPVDLRRLRVEAANNAARGKIQSDEHRMKIAMHYESYPECRQSKYEREFQSFLIRNNIEFVPQKAFNRYNVDFAFEKERIAVELFGGIWHGSDRHVDKFNRKSKLLFSMGWSIVVVWCRGGLAPDKITNYIDTIDKNAPPRHYVISGYAKQSRIGNKKIDYLPSLASL